MELWRGWLTKFLKVLANFDQASEIVEKVIKVMDSMKCVVNNKVWLIDKLIKF